MSKKKRLSKTLVEKILDKNQIAYQSVTFATQKQGDVQQISPEQTTTPQTIYKTLVLDGNKTGPLVGVIPLNKHLSYKLLAQASQNKKVAMVPLKKLKQTSGFEHGANSPIGIREQHNYPIYFDSQAQIDQQITISAGKIGRSVTVDIKDVLSLVDGHLASLSVDSPED
ncbi:Cys-tRNA(Pro) deacylase [Bombilactobacillus folatiphilus]|uniref:Cys-tRNA(Pro)/Cys-tRNA(Cys) deacylase n=1 Tax=Bombilactobacillus folatiphilus TaxID=2923362 RepID=A0ABY4P7F7_9LACO|nr:YbaK/EbsC family protein [Bombilactobacillus folatiphilus]UQS81547.1 Cys-tRNA(Pro) deacylase [Bombilactobacillus folatiphilus]